MALKGQRSVWKEETSRAGRVGLVQLWLLRYCGGLAGIGWLAAEWVQLALCVGAYRGRGSACSMSANGHKSSNSQADGNEIRPAGDCTIDEAETSQVLEY